MQPAALKSLNGTLPVDSKSNGPARRKALAEWIADPANPLTARVMVNRIWHHTFGTGIVSTPSDFGKAGAMPTHPELLDWLAAEFVSSADSVSGTEGRPFSMKRIIRMLVMSKAFRQSSLPNSDALAKDASSIFGDRRANRPTTSWSFGKVESRSSSSTTAGAACLTPPHHRWLSGVT
ncbi:DUF1553 domain-containing protein [Fuerstiella marisgermanici]|uniref:DUF1553 domain-containing protein n=1 Tax=Fuerstiella marisgermanici TaxID=1891926 RepID=UPI00097C202C|nr:DUF1553 domain-containing protein [Fuerstiella marisgermanici]